MINLGTSYPGKVVVDANNPNGTFKNRTNDALKDGTPFERGWASTMWGFFSHVMAKAGLIPNGAEENEVNSQIYDGLNIAIGRRAVKFETEDLIINVQSSTTVDMDALRASFLDSDFIPKYLNDIDKTFTMPGDLEAGTSEKNAHDYGLWMDSDEVLRLVPDLVGTTDSTVVGAIADSAATWLTDLVHDGDIVYNLTTKAKTKASADAAAEGQFTLVDDIFTSGDDYKIVKMSPEGLGENRERFGTAYNNSGGDFDDSYYTQIQEEKSYTELAGDFALSGSGWATTDSLISVRQLNDWTGKGIWKVGGNISGSHNSAGSFTITITGIIFKYTQSVSTTVASSSLALDTSRANGGDGTFFNSAVSGNFTASQVSFDVEVDKKPTFHN